MPQPVEKEIAMNTNADIEREYQKLLMSEPSARQAWNAAEFNNLDDITRLKLICVALGVTLHNTRVVLEQKNATCTCDIRQLLRRMDDHDRQHQKIHPNQPSATRQDDGNGYRQEAMAQQQAAQEESLHHHKPL